MRVFQQPPDIASWQEYHRRTLDAFQEMAGPLPRCNSFPFGVEVLEEVFQPHYTRRKIAFETEPGDVSHVHRLQAWVLVPHQRAGRGPAMLCLHQTTAAGKDQPAGLSSLHRDPPSLAYAAELAERGYVTLAPDYPSFGEARTMPHFPPDYVSGTMKGIWNHRLAVDLLEGLPEVDPARIGVIGHSLGGHNSIYAAVFDERLRAVVTSCGFTSLPKFQDGSMEAWAQPCYMPRVATRYAGDPDQVPFDFSDLLCALAPRLLLINAPLYDDNFHAGGVDDCVEIARPVYRLFDAENRIVLEHPNAGHEFPHEVRKRLFARLDDYFEKS